MPDTPLLDEPTTTGTKPVKVFRVRGLSVSVFPSRVTVRNREVTMFNSTLRRTYKAGDEFKTTSSLSRDDLLIGQQLLGQAWAWIVAEEAKLKAIAK